MKKNLVPFFLAASVLIAASGCAAQQPQVQQVSDVEEYVGVCIDPETQNRVDDEYCDETNDGYNPFFMPYFYPYGYMIPGIGLPVYGGHSSHSGPYRMGFDKKGGSSNGFKSTSKQYLTKGYSLPSNANIKPAQPKATQPAPPAGLRTTPAPMRSDIPKAPARPAVPAQPAQPAVPAQPKTDTKPAAPQNNYKAPKSGVKSKSGTTTRSRK